ncbi:hypothetical protein VDGD_09421 [Verticillium dahliae]|nr:Enoyl-CoA hydratase/isomerase [Verticillium dahliae VDG1]RBQ82800.1 hypothetical protein VDGD_09421 [Verticillium dahliae]
MLPFFEVSHLPSSSSFYSAVLQPLGLYYISATSQPGDEIATVPAPTSSSPSSSSATALVSEKLPATITYGTSSPPVPLFQIREAHHPRLSNVTFSAASTQTVADFHAFAIRANPPLSGVVTAAPSVTSQGQGLGLGPAHDSHAHRGCGDWTRTSITDLDGNTMDVVYQDPSSRAPAAPSQHGGSVAGTHRSFSTHEESSRILDWNFDVAASDHNPWIGQQPGPASVVSARTVRPGTEPCTVLRRSVTTSIIEQQPVATARDTSSGFDTTTVVGALLGAAAGAAAGAALTYSMLRGERERAPRQELAAPPPVIRRSTYPDRLPALQDGGRYVEVERTVEKIRYPEAYAPLADHRPAPQYLAKYSHVNSPHDQATDNTYDDGRSRHTTRSVASRRGARPPSEAPNDARRPLMIMDTEHRSNAGSRYSTVEQQLPLSASRSVRGPPTAPPSVRGPPTAVPSVHGPIMDSDRDTYVSARSRRSSTTIRGPPPPTVETELAVRSRATSRAPSKAPSTRAPSVRAPSVRAPSVREPSVVAAPSVRAPSVREPSVVAAPSRAPSVREPSIVAIPSRAPSKAPSRARSSASRAPSKAASHAGGMHDAVMGGNTYSTPPNASRTPSHVSARNIGLPMSGVGSSHAAWDDDVVSVAPSDSISCVGSKMSRRRYNP